ncbi:MAG TPA: TonB-dependent receptor [Ohtaekwangia sp.]
MLHIRIVGLLVCFIFPRLLQAQPCQWSLNGFVKDINGIELTGATIWLDSGSTGVISDENGAFQLKDLCQGRVQLIIKFVGYEDAIVQVSLPLDQPLVVSLNPSAHLLHDVIVIGDHLQQHGLTQSVSSLSTDELETHKGKSLGELTQRIPGVNALMTGPSVFKPVIHGLHSQRILILNNSVRQEGQQWGIEHAPEIDTYIASEIEVVKGAESVRYGADAMGGVVLINPAPVFKSYSFGGEINAMSMTNNRMFALSGMTEGKFRNQDYWDWRIQGTVKKGGDFHAPDYNLSNTGVDELNGSAALGYQKAGKQFEIFFSSFNTQLGILRSAHTGNLEDLQNTIESGRPWYIEDFTYSINNPKQRINHQLLKLKASARIKPQLKINLTYGGQYNQRKEYDVRRGGRSEKPALSMNLISHALDLTLDHTIKQWAGSIGMTGSIKDNTNEPGLGIKPLIPDYDQYIGGVFIIEKYRKNNWLLELGARYDLQYLKVLTFDSQDNLIEHDFSYHNILGAVGASYYFSDEARLTSNLAFSVRPPHVSESFSLGLHHSAGVIEEGLMVTTNNPKNEFSKNWVTTYQVSNKKLSLEISGFVHLIDNYIYLRPVGTRLTIRGYFPVFQYHQTDAMLTGADVMIIWNITNALSYTGKFSYVYAEDIGNDDQLLFIPPAQFDNSLTWKTNSGKLRGLTVTARVSSTLEQVNAPRTVPPDQVVNDDSDKNFDFMDAPEAYTLVNIDVGKTFPAGKNELFVALSAENLFDVSYRNYMNRLRYYADDIGRNVMVRVSYKFKSNNTKNHTNE